MMVMNMFAIKHYQLPMNEEDMIRLKQLTNTDTAKDALTAAVAFTLENYPTEDKKKGSK
jgi:hypothetical protein